MSDATGDVRVLVVEDEPLVAEAHAAYTRRVVGFEVVGVAHSAGAEVAEQAEAVAVGEVHVEQHQVDLAVAEHPRRLAG